MVVKAAVLLCLPVLLFFIPSCSLLVPDSDLVPTVMASLNWTQLDKNDHPIPLPHEKFLSTIPHVSLSLSSPSLSSLGTLHISNLRFILISLSPRSSATPATPGGTSTDLDSLSVPYTHFHDGRFIQPMFGAQRYEATILPSPGGGLTVRPPPLSPLKLVLTKWGNQYEHRDLVR
jgi:hypothetical protein